MRILITNSVPLNGGDEALLRATYLSLKEAFGNPKITVLCMNLLLCRKYITDIPLDWDFEFTQRGDSSTSSKIRRWLSRHYGIRPASWFSLLFASNEEQRVTGLYKKADLIVSAPGGFLHDHYPLNGRIKGFELAFSLNKPIVIFAQSIGPFWHNASKKLIAKILPKFSAVILREANSLASLNSVGKFSNISMGTDAAFLWRKFAANLYKEKKGPIKTIAMCFRDWPIVENKIGYTIEKAIKLCEHLLSDPERRIVFLSTCQGIDGYVDDSIHASRIKNGLREELSSRCEIITERYSPTDLILNYSQFDAFIGMRLHSAILAMLGGTVALGIGYEEKTAGIFNDLGLCRYQVNYDSAFEDWKTCTDNFLNEASDIRLKLPAILDKAFENSYRSIEITKKAFNGYRY